MIALQWADEEMNQPGADIHSRQMLRPGESLTHGCHIVIKSKSVVSLV
jgi:hypothetical protein